MKLWKKLDLFGRAIVLLAVAFQLSLVSELQGVQQRGDVSNLMENQAWMASMIYTLSTTRAQNEIENENSEAQSRITLFSDWDKSRLHNQVRIVNIIFTLLFLCGSILIITGRYLEINEVQVNS